MGAYECISFPMALQHSSVSVYGHIIISLTSLLPADGYSGCFCIFFFGLKTHFKEMLFQVKYSVRVNTSWVSTMGDKSFFFPMRIVCQVWQKCPVHQGWGQSQWLWLLSWGKQWLEKHKSQEEKKKILILEWLYCFQKTVLSWWLLFAERQISGFGTISLTLLLCE